MQQHYLSILVMEATNVTVHVCGQKYGHGYDPVLFLGSLYSIWVLCSPCVLSVSTCMLWFPGDQNTIRIYMYAVGPRTPVAYQPIHACCGFRTPVAYRQACCRRGAAGPFNAQHDALGLASIPGAISQFKLMLQHG